ncbi:MAG: hypothetical protein ABR911_01615 [Syntrophales bacterium]
MKKKELESQQSDFKAFYFPSFLFSFSHKMPKVPSTCVEYRAKYNHWNKELTLYRTIWDDNRRKIATCGGEEKDDVTAKGNLERCYDRCKQPQNTLNKCDACFIEENSILGFENEVAWKLFYDNATFEEIVTPDARTIFDKPRYDLREAVETLPRYPCTGSIISHDKVCKLTTCPEEINATPISKCSHYYDYCKKWLHATRDNQDYFIHRLKKDTGFDEAMTILMRVLHAARWHIDKKERETARHLLLDHLIPLHIDHKTGFLPHYKILIPMREILCKLASNLSKKCKKEYLQGEDLRDPDIMKYLISWAEENDLRIFNIASESKETIVRLIRTPADYANSFMAKHYNISIRTLKMSLKKSTANLTRLY